MLDLVIYSHAGDRTEGTDRSNAELQREFHGVVQHNQWSSGGNAHCH